MWKILQFADKFNKINYRNKWKQTSVICFIRLEKPAFTIDVKRMPKTATVDERAQGNSSFSFRSLFSTCIKFHRYTVCVS